MDYRLTICHRISRYTANFFHYSECVFKTFTAAGYKSFVLLGKFVNGISNTTQDTRKPYVCLDHVNVAFARNPQQQKYDIPNTG